mmetsp:Transcript_58611/g.154002  ORF Transcript_58611/g.154002 Transcript_58611/m.154002 type:complete len:217 (-) Transcript_58611:393-1043(-)
MVGMAPSIRAVLVMTVGSFLSCGTLKSTRMRTRLPLTSTDDSCSLSNADFLGALATEIALTMSANSGLSDAPPTRNPSMSGHAESSGAFLAFAEPPYWMRIIAAQNSETLAAIHARISLCVSCACCGVATSPVPMAQTGSYAMTTSFIISAETPLRPSVSCTSHTLKVSPDSRSSLSSPMQRMHLRPSSRTLSVFLLTSVSLSPKTARRSEWPVST